MRLMVDVARIGRIPQWRVEEILRKAEKEAKAIQGVKHA